MDNAIDSSNAIRLFVRDYIAPFLKEAGFSKKGMNFHRQRDDIIDVFNIQGNSHNGWGNSVFYLNYGMDSVEFRIQTDQPVDLKRDYTLCLYSHRLFEGPDDRQNLRLMENSVSVDFAQFSKELLVEIQQLLDHFNQITSTQQLVNLAISTQGLQHYEEICRYLTKNHDVTQLRKYISRLHSKLHTDDRWPFFSEKITTIIGEYANEPDIGRLLTPQKHQD